MNDADVIYRGISELFRIMPGFQIDLSCRYDPYEGLIYEVVLIHKDFEEQLYDGLGRGKSLEEAFLLALCDTAKKAIQVARQRKLDDDIEKNLDQMRKREMQRDSLGKKTKEIK